MRSTGVSVEYDVILGRSEVEPKLVNASSDAQYLTYQVNYDFIHCRSEAELELIIASYDAGFVGVSGELRRHPWQVRG